MGLSSPYFASSAACACGLIAFSDKNGPPGTRFIRKKVSVATAQIVTIASKILFTMYLNMAKLLFYCLLILMVSPILFFGTSTVSTCTSTISPTLTASSGCLI